MTIPEKSSIQPLMIGEILVQADIVQEHQLPRALQMAKDRSLRVGQVLVMMRYLSDEELEPILEIQKLINDGAIDSTAAIEALKIMRRDGLPLIRAVKMVQAEPANKAEKLQLLQQVKKELSDLENTADTAQRDLVPTLLKLGDVTLDLREYADAEQYYKRSLAIVEYSHGQKNIKTLSALRKLLDLLMLQQRYDEAEVLCWRFVEIHQTVLGLEHVDTAHAVLKLARILDAQGKMTDAEQFLLSAIRILEKQLGIEHPELKIALRHFAAFWKRKSKKTEYKRIGELLVDAELVSAEQLGAALQESHASGIPVGQVLVKGGTISAEVLRGGLQAQLLVQDGVIPVAVALKALRMVSVRGCNLEEALDEMGWSPDPISTQDLQKLMQTSEELMAAEKALGANHPGVAIIALKLGEQCMFARKFGNAESAYKRALHILRQCWGQNHIELTDVMFKLANLYYVQKRLSEAEAMHWQVLAIRKESLGDKHKDVIASLETIAKVQAAQGNIDGAEQMRTAAEALKNAGQQDSKPVSPTSVPSNLAFYDIAELLLNVEKERRTGQLTLSNHNQKEIGRIEFFDGQIVFVKYRHLQGTTALIDLISRDDPLDFKFNDGKPASKPDSKFESESIQGWIDEARRRADELPGLLEEVGWPRTAFCKQAKVLDTNKFSSEDIASVAADIWMFIEDAAENATMMEGVYSDRHTFLVALKEMLKQGMIVKNRLESTGSFNRLTDLLS